VEALAEIWRGLHPATVMLGRPVEAKHPKRTLRARLLMAALGRVGRGRSSLYDDAGMRTILATHIGDVSFEELALPLRVIAANLTYGGRGVFSSGPVAPAVLASSAIPGIFPPVRIGDAVYADGGTVDGCSVETAVALGARRIFVLANGFDLIGDGGARWAASSPGDSYSMAAVLQRASQVMGTFQIQQALERVPRDVETHVISLSTGDDGGTLNFGAVSAWIERSYAATRAYLQGVNSTTSSRMAALPRAVSHVA
jgi:NTE family protein